LSANFPDLRFVWLRRDDKVRQGISWWRAVVTDQWALRHDEPAKQHDMDVAHILPLVRYATECEQGWRDWFAAAGITPLEITYERLVADRLATTNDVLSHLDLPRLDSRSLPAEQYRRQADEQTDRYVELVTVALTAERG
jgi:LPS sulfotransferase NodH